MNLIKEVDFTPVDKLVVTFDKYRTYSTEYTVMDTEKNAGKDPLVDEMETKVVKKKVNYNHQVATIMAVPANEEQYKVGDLILVDLRACLAIDGYKDIFIIPKYNVFGLMKNNS
jgi:hypothetical protein